jgi:hypothetical protein
MPYMKKDPKTGKSVRDYGRERDLYHSRPEQMANNRARKKARRELEAEGKVKPFDGKDVDHKTPLKRGGGNGKSNLRVQSKTTNRSVAKTSGNRMKKNG